jgi:hypothetical protein
MSTDVSWVKEQFPFLENFSDEFLKSTPITELMKMGTTQIKLDQFKHSRNANDKLSTNKNKMERTFTNLDSGRDNRSTVLHPGRFLGGMGVSLQKQWSAARQVVGLNGHPPIGNYDMGSVGCPGMVTAKGWTEIHDPSSTSISLKMFNINNCTNSEKAEDREFNDIMELRKAVRAMRLAARLAVPWNLSYEAIDGFFNQTNFCVEDTKLMEKRAQVLTQFADYILHQNAERWRDSEPFLAVGDIRVAWSSWFGDRPRKTDKRPQLPDRFKMKPMDNYMDPAFKALGICNNFNMNRCKNPDGKCSTASGIQLKHICNFVPDKNKPAVVCGKDHKRSLNH